MTPTLAQGSRTHKEMSPCEQTSFLTKTKTLANSLSKFCKPFYKSVHLTVLKWLLSKEQGYSNVAFTSQ